MRKTYLVVTSLLLTSGVLQLFFAGYMFFQNTHQESVEAGVFHSANGQYVLRSLALLSIIFAALARAGSKNIWMATGIFLLSWLQLFIFILGGMLTGSSEDHVTPAGSWLIALHPVNGLLIIFISYWLFRRARALMLKPQPLPPAEVANAEESAATT